VIPSGIKDAYFDKWKTIQSGYQKMIKECFSPIPIFSLELLDQEIVGKELLVNIAKKLYGRNDPTRLFLTQKPIEILKRDGGFDMFLNLPFVDKADIDLYKNGEELIIKVGNFKRNILLPQILIGFSIKSAKFEADRLKISFRQ